MIQKISSFLCVLFIGLLLWKDVAAFSWNIHFYINQKQLAKAFCENKKRPALKCNGKCYLAKQLKKLEAKEQSNQNKQQPPLKIKDSEITVWNSFDFFMAGYCFNENTKSEELFTYINHIPSTYSESIFHPPQQLI